jgi:hypothetical protein
MDIALRENVSYIASICQIKNNISGRLNEYKMHMEIICETSKKTAALLRSGIN